MRYLLSASEYSKPNPRIDGFKKLDAAQAATVKIYVTSLETFSYYLDNKKLPVELTRKIKEVLPEIIESISTHSVAVRRAYVIPGMDNPPGPRFVGLSTAEEVAKAITDIFDFAISQKYNAAVNSQIVAFFHASIGTPKYEETNEDLSLVPYGGYAINQNGFVEIYSVFGINEGVQSLMCDHYITEERRDKFYIVRKEIPQKNKMLCTTPTEGVKLINVPIEVQFDQVLSDGEIIEVARIVGQLSKKYGPQRVEFSSEKSNILFNEVADYWKESKKDVKENIHVRGVVRVINTIDDFRELAKVAPKDFASGKIIIKVGEQIITNRDYDVLGALATWKDSLYVLYPGVAATQHAMRVLSDKGHKAFLIGNQTYETGDETQIVVTGAKVAITNLSRTQNQKYVSLWDASLLGVSLCGGKAERLSKLKILGFQVPHGAVLTTILFDELLTKLGYSTPIQIEDYSQIYKNLERPSNETIQFVGKLLTDYMKSGRKFAVRSSATIEDSSKDSMAGMFDTVLNVSGTDLPLKALKVIRSAFGPTIVVHLQSDKGLISKLKMAVTVQEMVPARCAGVIFGAKTQTRDLDIVEIEAQRGLAEEIVSGTAKNIEQYKFSRSERRVVERKGPELLSPSELKALFMLSERLKAEFDDIPQDIEWAIDTSGQVWVLQSRDLYLERQA